MSPSEALADIRGYAAANRVELSEHAKVSMRKRRVRYRDIRNALTNAATCADQGDATWRASGPDLEGDELTAVVAIEDGLLVVTVF